MQTHVKAQRIVLKIVKTVTVLTNYYFDIFLEK